MNSTPEKNCPPFPAWAPAVLLALMTLLAYLPVWHAGFIWDDDAYVTQNVMLTAPDGLRQIWFSAHRQSQYFPLVYTTFRLEHAFWGVDPRGYHAVNVLLHMLNALLLWQLLRRLAVPGAWLAAAIFALHPVQVETVAWVTELKNVQSTLFYLLALLAWDEQFKIQNSTPINREQEFKIYYGLALIFYALALFSKTTACTLPAALLLIVWWRRETIGWRRMLQILPFLLLGVAMGLISVWWEKHLGNYSASDVGVQLGFVGKLLIATRAVWFYAAKLFWPVNLTFSYPRWEINPHAPWQYLGLAGCALCALLLWRWRRALGGGVVAGVIFFVAALSPMLGFIPLYTFRFSFVADHYQYLACTGLIIPFAALISKGMTSGRLGQIPGFCLSGLLLVALGVLTWRQTQIYADAETLWQDTLAKNPASWLAHNNLGFIFDAKNETDAAITEYREALRLKPDAAEVHYNFGNALAKEGQVDGAISQFREAIRLNPADVESYANLGIILFKQGQVDEAISLLQEAIHIDPDYAVAYDDLGTVLYGQGRVDEAISEYQAAIRAKPGYVGAHINLGIAFARESRIDEAIGEYQEAIRLQPDHALAHDSLGIALARKGLLDEAIGQFQEAIRLDPDNPVTRGHLAHALAQKNAPATK